MDIELERKKIAAGEELTASESLRVRLFMRKRHLLKLKSYREVMPAIGSYMRFYPPASRLPD